MFKPGNPRVCVFSLASFGPRMASVSASHLFVCKPHIKWANLPVHSRLSGDFTGVWIRCATRRSLGGFQECKRGHIKKRDRRLAKNCTLTRTSTIRRRHLTSPNSMLHTQLSATATSAKHLIVKIDAEGKRRFKGFEGFGTQPGRGHGPGAGCAFRKLQLRTYGFRRSSSGMVASRISCADVRKPRRRRARPGPPTERRRSRRANGAGRICTLR